MRTVARRNRLQYGGLTRVIIDTVAESGRITARDLTEILFDRGVRVTRHQMSVRLAELAQEGRVQRVGKGVFTAV